MYGWELRRTHWALKDVDLAKELAAKGIKLPSWARKGTPIINVSDHVFDVALSFPGEIREFVQNVASELEGLLGPDRITITRLNLQDRLWMNYCKISTETDQNL